MVAEESGGVPLRLPYDNAARVDALPGNRPVAIVDRRLGTGGVAGLSDDQAGPLSANSMPGPSGHDGRNARLTSEGCWSVGIQRHHVSKADCRGLFEHVGLKGARGQQDRV